jgi:hypothetical protein
VLIGASVGAKAQLCFIDAHAMSPFAFRHPEPGQTRADFDTVAARLPAQDTPYERAWHDLSIGGRCLYPSSALLVRQLWKGRLDLVLCETDEATSNEIAEWRASLTADTSCELYGGDWRMRFRQDFPSGSSAYLISFDPYMFDRHPVSSTPRLGNMRPGDIVRAGAASQELGRAPVVLQLSTYSANNANSQHDVIACIEPVFQAAGLELVATIRADRSMMSMVFARGIPTLRDAGLQQRFRAWLERATADKALADAG